LALGVRGFVRIGATIAGCALVAACTPDQPPAVTPTPSPTVAASPTPSATPTETDIERQMRLDWEAAEKAYRASTSESNRLHQLGGAKLTSPALKAVATGRYLQLESGSLRYLRSRGWRFRGGVTIVSVKKVGGWSATRLSLLSCEDNSTWRVIDRNGRDVTPKNQPDYIQTLELIQDHRRWKVSDVASLKVVDVDGSAECQ
jgi:hypothetical protein